MRERTFGRSLGVLLDAAGAEAGDAGDVEALVGADALSFDRLVRLVAVRVFLATLNFVRIDVTDSG